LIEKYAAYAPWDNNYVAVELPFGERFDDFQKDQLLIVDIARMKDEVARYRDELAWHGFRKFTGEHQMIRGRRIGLCLKRREGKS
jgi:hypothetical protein